MDRKWSRKLILGAAALTGLTANSGCLINQYSGDNNQRTKELLNQSEDLRQMKSEWQRFWFIDQPSHLGPERIHGGIISGES